MIVFKYGGTSLKDEVKLLKTVKEGLKEYNKIILIVSAIGRYPEAYSTDTLFKMCDSSSQLEIARMVSCGEVISSVRVSNILNKNLIKAISLSIYDINLTYEDGFNVNDKINKYLNNYDVIIIPGFIGLKENEVRLLPRGGSNITASFFAYYFKCDLVIFTDVDGLYYEDPKKNIKAEKIKILSYETLKEITKDNHALFPIEGIKYLEMGNVKVLIRNTEYKYGTVIKKI